MAFRSMLRCVKEHAQDRDDVLIAVSHFGHLLEFAADELRADKGVVLAAVAKEGSALKFALYEDADVVCTAVSKDGRALEFASSAMQSDRDIVMAAMRHDGFALQWASADLRDDFDVVLAAAQSNGAALQYASTRLRASKEIVIAAFANYAHALHYALLCDADLQDVIATSKWGEVSAVAKSLPTEYWTRKQGAVCTIGNGAVHRYANSWCEDNEEETDPTTMDQIPPGERRGVCLDGHCYDAMVLKKWLHSHPSLPLTRAVFSVSELAEVLEQDGTALPRWWRKQQRSWDAEADEISPRRSRARAEEGVAPRSPEGRDPSGADYALDPADVLN
jgi:hypothetical protein